MKYDSTISNHLLNKIPNQLVEVWWGTGSNGKTTLFKKLKESSKNQDLHLENDVDENQLLELIKNFNLSLKNKPNARYIIELNNYPEILNQVLDDIEVYHFKDQFIT